MDDTRRTSPEALRSVKDAHHMTLLIRWVSLNRGCYSMSRGYTGWWHLRVQAGNGDIVFDKNSKDLSKLVELGAKFLQQRPPRLDQARKQGDSPGRRPTSPLLKEGM